MLLILDETMVRFSHKYKTLHMLNTTSQCLALFFPLALNKLVLCIKSPRLYITE